MLSSKSAPVSTSVSVSICIFICVCPTRKVFPVFMKWHRKHHMEKERGYLTEIYNRVLEGIKSLTPAGPDNKQNCKQHYKQTSQTISMLYPTLRCIFVLYDGFQLIYSLNHLLPLYTVTHATLWVRGMEEYTI